MCATYTCKQNEVKLPWREKLQSFGVVPRERIRPTDSAPVIVAETQGLVARDWRWGWTVPWDRQPRINARSETLTTVALYRAHLEQRCLLPADGFLEGGVWFHQPGAAAFCFAGLWREEAVAPPGERREVGGGHRPPLQPGSSRVFTLLTTTPNGSVAPHHDRMPFIVKPELYAEWLLGDWQRVLAAPDHAPLEKFQPQPELF